MVKFAGKYTLYIRPIDIPWRYGPLVCFRVVLNRFTPFKERPGREKNMATESQTKNREFMAGQPTPPRNKDLLTIGFP